MTTLKAKKPKDASPLEDYDYSTLKDIAENLKAKGIGSKEVKAIEVINKAMTSEEVALAVMELERNPNSELVKNYPWLITLFTKLSKDGRDSLKQYDLLQINIDEEIELFIRGCSRSGPVKTQSMYRGAVKNFRSWAKGVHNKDLQYLTPKEAHEYVRYLMKQPPRFNDEGVLSNNSINGYLTGVMAFYSYLHRKFPVVGRILEKLHSPPSVNSKPINYPSIKEAKAILKHLKDINSIIAFLVELELRTGFRVSAFQTLEMDCKGNFKIYTKGKRLNGNFYDYDHNSNGKPMYKGLWKHSIIDLFIQRYGQFKGRIKPFIVK